MRILQGRHDKINEVIGGDNANQYFCMTFPATLLAKESYEYDYKNGKAKPLTVEAKESRLASAHVQSSGKSVTIRFTDPQVLGYYMEATAADNSTYIDNDTSIDKQVGFVTIMEFVNKCKDAFEKLNN